MTTQPKTLAEALKTAERKARADVYGFTDPFSAVAWRKTLPAEWQRDVEAVIVHIYHTT
jgi:hypothetical protein